METAHREWGPINPPMSHSHPAHVCAPARGCLRVHMCTRAYMHSAECAHRGTWMEAIPASSSPKHGKKPTKTKCGSGQVEFFFNQNHKIN